MEGSYSEKVVKTNQTKVTLTQNINQSISNNVNSTEQMAQIQNNQDSNFIHNQKINEEEKNVSESQIQNIKSGEDQNNHSIENFQKKQDQNIQSDQKQLNAETKIKSVQRIDEKKILANENVKPQENQNQDKQSKLNTETKNQNIQSKIQNLQMDDSDSLQDIDDISNENIEVTFDDLKTQLVQQPQTIQNQPALCRALYHYCKDQTKHGKIIRYLFYPVIMTLIEDSTSTKTQIFGLKTFNQLIQCEASLAAVLAASKASKIQAKHKNIEKIITYVNKAKDEGQDINQLFVSFIIKEGEEGDERQKQIFKEDNLKILTDFIAHRENPLNTLLKILRETNSQQLLQQCSQSIKIMAQAPDFINALIDEYDFFKIFEDKFLAADPNSQENLLETVLLSCEFEKFRKCLVQNSKILDLIIVTVQSVSLKASYLAIKILQTLSKDKLNIESLQGDCLRLTQTLVSTYQWLELKQNKICESKNQVSQVNETQTKQEISQILEEQSNHSNEDAKEEKKDIPPIDDLYNLIFIEISKCFKNILMYIETHERLLEQAQKLNKIDSQNFEIEMISTLLKLGRKKIDQETYINASMCISHITEVLPCNPAIAQDDVIHFMLESLQDFQNLNYSKQGCRYFANLSFYKEFRENLIKKDIGSLLLSSLDEQKDEEIIKHSTIALANISSHKGFFEIINNENDEKWSLKPLFALIDPENEASKINIIQSACITLCNISSKPQLHHQFRNDFEINALKKCLTNPIDQTKQNDLVRFVIKIVLNLTKNVENHEILSKNGYLESLFDLLDYEQQKDIFGNVVMAVSYMSLQKECLEKFMNENIFSRILDPLKMIHEVDQKMIMIAITSMLFNGIEIQREFIRHDGLGKLLFFMQQQDKIFQQLACKSFSLLSENQENLQDIIDQDCLNTIIVSCLKTKEIDLETIKEILKIFINLILWRKISKETFETTCCICDIGLLIDDYDVNILAIFCLNSLSENEETHSFIRNSGISIQQNDNQISQVLENTKQSAAATKGSVDSGAIKYNSQSVFNQINYLLELYQNRNDNSADEQEKQGLIISLITSFYLNLARNQENIHFLLQLQIFKKLNNLMKSFTYQNNIENTALCYTNTIFSKLLKNPDSIEYCIEEEGYDLLIQILKGKEPNKHLFQETLDSIKVFLNDREYLTRFKEIPDYFQIDTEYPELNVSYLQILAVLSFEKENHSRFKNESFINALKDGGDQSIFNIMFNQIESNIENEKTLDGQNPQKLLKSAEKRDRSLDQKSPRLRQNDFQGGGAAGGNANKSQLKGKGKLISRRNRIRENQDKINNEEIALAVSIIFANLSSDYEFIRMLLEVDQWNIAQKQQQISLNKNIFEQAGSKADKENQLEEEDEVQDQENGQNYRAIFQKQPNFQNLQIDDKNFAQKNFAFKYPELVEYDDEILKNQESVILIKNIFNLLSHDNIYIQEQIIILLVNISNSPFFRKIFISDLCIKSLLKQINDHANDSIARISQLAALIIILNLSSKCDDISTFENINLISTLQDIIKDEFQPNLNKSIALLAISNMQIISGKISSNINQHTRDFGFQVLLNWKKILDEKDESPEVVKNLVYASLVLFYNLILKKVCSNDLTSHLINVIADRMLSFQDEQIINVLLELIILFTSQKDQCDLLLHKQLILDYVFEKVQTKNLSQETFRLSWLSLSRIAARINEENSNIFIQKLKQTKFKQIVDIINGKLKNISIQLENQKYEDIEDQNESLSSSQLHNEISEQKVNETINEIVESNRSKMKVKEEENLPLSLQKDQIDCTLRYFMSFLENITSFKKIREILDCEQLIKEIIDLFTDYITTKPKISIINVLFNLNFSLKKAMILEKDFLQKMYRFYIDELKGEENAKRKIVTIVVSASALDQNHKPIIKSGFYQLFKKNISENYSQLVETDEEVELFGLVNIVLNQSCIHLIYQDLKKIHKVALKNNKIEFKTKVDLLIECRKYLSNISSLEGDQQDFSKQLSKNIQPDSSQSEQFSESHSEREVLQNTQEKNSKKIHAILENNKSEIIDCCLKALIFSIIKLIGLLDTNDFSMFKYLLNAINDCSQNLQSHLIYLIKIENLIEFLKRVLFQQFQFDMKEYDDQVLNFSLKNIVCEIFYNLMQEKQFLKLNNISETIKLLVKFSQSIIEMNVEKKMHLVSKTIRLVSQLLPEIQTKTEFQSSDIQKCFVDFIKDALILSKDLQPCVNIDAIYCLINMMDIKELALHETLLSIETVNNVMVIYFAYNNIIELDECVVTYLYLISQFKEYHQILQGKHKALFYLMEKQIDQKTASSNDQSRQKIFSLFHNLTENEEICQQMDAKQLIDLSVRMLQQTSINKYSADHIHELSLKSIINFTKYQNQQIDQADLQQLFVVIYKIFPRLKNLPKQYAIRLITIFIKKWKDEKIQDFLSEIINILSQFIENCDSVIELKFIIMNLQKIASMKQFMKSLADKTEQCKQLLKTIHNFIERNFQNAEQHSQIEQLLRFCKKVSKQPKAQQYLVDEAIHETALEYISQNLSFTKIHKNSSDDNSLKQTLVTIQNIMKMIKNIYDGNISKEQQHEIYLQVTKRENIINDSDQLLKNCKNSESKDELAIIIVNIILSYNSISKKLDAERVRSWIQTFSERLISTSNNSYNRDEQARSWYLEKYVLIIELLVTKNLDKIDKNVTFHLLKIYEINDNTKYFTNTIWYKLIKILAHIQNIQDITHKSYIENIMTFIMVAYEKTNENLCFFYFMKIVLLILKKTDSNALVKHGFKQYDEVLSKCFQYLKINKENKTDPLTLEILLYIIDMVNFLMKFHLLHQKLNKFDIMIEIIQMIKIHENPLIMKSLTATLLESSKITTFYPDLLKDQSLNILLNKVISYTIEPNSLNNIFECIRNIIQQTKSPIKYLIATSILKITEDNQVNWKNCNESNLFFLLKILSQNINFLTDDDDENKENVKNGQQNVQEEDMKEKSIMADINQRKEGKQKYQLENLEELQLRALKYSVMAITNILIQSDKELIFNNRISVLSVLRQNCLFELDPQMNLRLLYLLNVQLGKVHARSKIQNSQNNNGQQKGIYSKKDVQRPKSSIQNYAQKEEEKKQEIIQTQEIQEEQKIQAEVINEMQPKQDLQTSDTIDLVNFLIENISKFRSVIQVRYNKVQIEIPKIESQINENKKNPFFFEEDQYQLNKISAIRLSLSFSVQVLYYLTNQKKKVACQAILDNANSINMFSYFIPYVVHSEINSFKQIKQIIKIVLNCSENTNIQNILLDIDCVTHFIKLVEKVMKDDFSHLNVKNKQEQKVKQIAQYTFNQDPSQKENLHIRKKIVVKVMKILINLSSTDLFFWYFNSDISGDFLKLVNEIEDVEIQQMTGNLSAAILDQKKVTKGENIDQTKLVMEILSLKDQQSLDQGAISIMNIEKLILNKKIKLELLGEDEFMSMMLHLEKILIFHGEELNRKHFSIEEEQNSKKRRVIIKSTLEIFSFVYKKKYLANMVQGYSEQKQQNQVCAIEHQRSLRILKDNMFTALKKAQNLENKSNLEHARYSKTPTIPAAKGKSSVQVNLDGIVSFPDFRDISDILIQIFCLLSISPNFSIEDITEYVLPIGQLALAHTLYSLDKTLSTLKNASFKPSDNGNEFKAQIRQISEKFQIQKIKDILNSVVTLFQNYKQNQQILQKFDLAGLLNTVLELGLIFEQLSNEDEQLKEQYQIHIQGINVNLELLIKTIYFCPIELMPSSITLIHKLLEQQQYKKSAFFAVYCIALMIQDSQSQKECVSNLIPVFSDKIILQELFESIKIVDQKFKEYNNIKIKNSQLIQKDMLEKYENHSKNSIINYSKQMKLEIEAQKEFDQALAIRMSSLQIIVVIVEFLSNAMIKNEQVILEAKSKEVKFQSQPTFQKTHSQAKVNDINQVILTSITAKQHEKLTQIIHIEFDLLDLIIQQVAGRIPQILKQDQTIVNENKQENNLTYMPKTDEIKLAARIFASTPFQILKKRNPIIEPTQQSQERQFSIQLYFQALSDLLVYSQSNKYIQNIEKNLNSQNLQGYLQQISYFALFALLDFVIHLPLEPAQKQQRSPISSPSGLQILGSPKEQNNIPKLDKMNYNKMMECLNKTRLLQNAIKIPSSIQISCQEDESLIRMCMKLVISIIFKGQQVNSQNFFNFNSDVESKEQYLNIFYQSGIQDPKEIYQIMSQCSLMVQKLYNFEITQIYQESYVQYLHLLSQLTVNSIHLENQTQAGGSFNSIFSFDFITNFLIDNIYDIAEQYTKNNQRVRLQTSDINQQRNIIYQYFFINYLISISGYEIIKESQKQCLGISKNVQNENDDSPQKSYSVSQGIFIILIKILDSLSDFEFNDQLDQIVQSRIQTFEKFHDHQKIYESMDIGQQSSQQKKNQKPDPSSPLKRQIPQNSATMTILKMILFNLDKLFKSTKQAQDFYLQSNSIKSQKDQSDMKDKMQLISIDEQQLDLLVQLLVQNEQYGEIVNKVYEILQNLLEISKSSDEAYKNIAVVDMSKSLLQICIKHSSIYQCESAFYFLQKLVNISDKYQNKQDIEYSLSKIMPASMHHSQSRGTKRISKKTGSQIGTDSQEDNLKQQSQLSQYQQ